MSKSPSVIAKCSRACAAMLFITNSVRNIRKLSRRKAASGRTRITWPLINNSSKRTLSQLKAKLCMRVLITYKSSKYSRLSQANQANLDKPTLDQMQLAHQEHEDSLQELRRCLQKAGMQCQEIMRGQDFDPQDYDVVLSVGGGGT